MTAIAAYAFVSPGLQSFVEQWDRYVLQMTKAQAITLEQYMPWTLEECNKMEWADGRLLEGQLPPLGRYGSVGMLRPLYKRAFLIWVWLIGLRSPRKVHATSLQFSLTFSLAGCILRAVLHLFQIGPTLQKQLD
jgi:hypothetical protein